MDIRKTFATNIRKYRKAAHLSQERLAELAGLHRTYIGGIEQKRVNISLKNIGKIAAALDVDPAVLFLTDASAGSMGGRMPASGKSPGTTHGDDGFELKPHDVAIVSWDDGGVTFQPIDETGFRDLTTHVLVELIEKGYTGSELAQRYQEVLAEINDFLA